MKLKVTKDSVYYWSRETYGKVLSHAPGLWLGNQFRLFAHDKNFEEFWDTCFVGWWMLAILEQVGAVDTAERVAVWMVMERSEALGLDDIAQVLWENAGLWRGSHVLPTDCEKVAKMVFAKSEQLDGKTWTAPWRMEPQKRGEWKAYEKWFVTEGMMYLANRDFAGVASCLTRGTDPEEVTMIARATLQAEVIRQLVPREVAVSAWEGRPFR